MPTCIIGAKCKDGAAIVSDRRVMRGLETYNEDKINILQMGSGASVVVASSGLTGIMDRFVPQTIEAIEMSRAKSLWEVINEVEAVLDVLCGQYGDRLERARLGQKQEELIDVFVSGLDRLIEGEARLFHCYGNGFSEEVKTFDILGHGSPYALPFLKLLYNPESSSREMMEIASSILLLIEKLEVDQSVGGLPDAAIIESGNKTPIEFTEKDMLTLDMKFQAYYEEMKANLRSFLWRPSKATVGT